MNSFVKLSTKINGKSIKFQFIQINKKNFLSIFSFSIVFTISLCFNEIKGGRNLKCDYQIIDMSEDLWPPFYYCEINYFPLTASNKDEELTFSGEASQKLRTTAVWLDSTSKVEFIPEVILTEFSQLNGLIITISKLPILFEGLFSEKFQILRYLFLGWNEIEKIEDNALSKLTNLEWIRISSNQIETLNEKIFANNLNLKFISFWENKIKQIAPNIFTNLKNLVILNLDYNECIIGKYVKASDNWKSLPEILQPCHIKLNDTKKV